jgi:molecular chaperone GrpE (heat shock protein)
MRYEILGFNQEKVIEAELDMTDLMILDYIIQANGDPSMEHIVKDGVAYVWIYHDKFLQDYPILPMSDGTFRNRLSELKQRGFILSSTERLIKGSKSYYSVSELTMSLRNDIRCHSKMTSDSISNIDNTKTTDSNTKTTTNTQTNIIIEEESKNRDTQNKAQQFVEDYNSICKSLPKCQRMTTKRSRGIAKLLRTYSYEDILTVFHNLEESDFCKGKNDRGWKADIDFILREDKFINVLEGKYNNKPRRNKVESFELDHIEVVSAEEKERMRKYGQKF